MIGHYLLTLTEEQEGRVLTETFLPYPEGASVIIYDGGTVEQRCLLDVANARIGGASCGLMLGEKIGRHLNEVGGAYDRSCHRFGVERINAAIRNRILSNRARRVLAGVSVGEAQQEQTR